MRRTCPARMRGAGVDPLKLPVPREAGCKPHEKLARRQRLAQAINSSRWRNVTERVMASQPWPAASSLLSEG